MRPRFDLVDQPALFRRSLRAWYRKSGRDLPWRRTRDPYAILVSEIMLQQTQVATVLPYYREWLRRFPDFQTLAAADEADVLHAWQGLGYYSRARNLHRAAKLVMRQWGGILPRPPKEIQTLPGIGRYTANAIATFAYDQSVPIVEANIARSLARLLNLKLGIDSRAAQQKLWQFARALLPKRAAAEHNSALMDLGALVCISGQPRCSICPVRKFCRAKDPARLPIKKPRTATTQLVETHAFIRRNGHILLEQSRARWRGLWMLPRLRQLPKNNRPLHTAAFPFTHHRVTLTVFARQCRRAGADESWFKREELARIPMPSPHRRALETLLSN